MKVVAYLRVSTDKQADEGNGLEVQRKAIQEWAKAHGYQVVAWYADEGLSGSNGLETRVALYEALNAVRDAYKGARGLVVKMLDRLSRDAILQEMLFRQVKSDGGELFSTMPQEQFSLTDDEADPSREMIRIILSAVMQYERKIIRLRLEAGRRMRHSAGGYAGYGSPAFGMTSAPDPSGKGSALVPDEAEQAAAARILELRGEGLSLREIIARLDAEGIRAKRGGGWSPSTVSRVIARAGMQ